jgi:hypothetical protein
MRSPLLMLIPAILVAQRHQASPVDDFDRELKRSRLDLAARWGALTPKGR